jgi:hypothetical protein
VFDSLQDLPSEGGTRRSGRRCEAAGSTREAAEAADSTREAAEAADSTREVAEVDSTQEQAREQRILVGGKDVMAR